MTETCAKKHDGKAVSVTDDKLTTTCGEGKQHCHAMAADLKPGTCVRAITNKDDKTGATAVESGKHIPAMGHKA
ncbi:MAG TPA: hypothetical protein DDY78_19870 [Planctomycetales bacterium]|nr:hypothetical protein [Planctomycetales bacterium]